MHFETLEINRLSRNGEILRKIRCLAGHITVFRSNSERDLTQLSFALSGLPGGETYTILLDGSTFSPVDHILVGFPEGTSSDLRLSLREYLRRVGVGEGGLDKMLLEFGLGGMKDRALSELTPVQLRTAEIIAATFCPTKVLVMCDPFEGMSKPVCEALAKLLADYAWETKAIVVVPKLLVRPDAWLENEIITRVQLERPRNPTIGLGTIDPALIAAAVAGAREGREEDFSQIEQRAQATSAAVPESPPRPLVQPPQRDRSLTQPEQPKRRRKSGEFEPGRIIQTPLHGVLAVGALIALMVVAIVIKDMVFSESSPVLITQQTIAPTTVAASPSPSEDSVSPMPKAFSGKEGPPAINLPPVKAPEVSPKASAPTVVAALSDYPADVRASITKVFEDPESVMKMQVATSKISPPTRVLNGGSGKPAPSENAAARNPFENMRGRVPELEGTTGEITAPPQSWNPEEMEARREEVRRRFLEAIQRASHEDEEGEEEE